MVTLRRFSKIPNGVLIETTECDDLVEQILLEDDLVSSDFLISMAIEYSNESSTNIRYWLRIFLVRKQKGYCYPWEDKITGRPIYIN